MYNAHAANNSDDQSLENRRARLAAKQQAELDALERSYQMRHGGGRRSTGASSRRRTATTTSATARRTSSSSSAHYRPEGGRANNTTNNNRVGQRQGRGSRGGGGSGGRGGESYYSEPVRSTAGRRTEPAPRYAASASHHDNKAYMHDFHQAYAALAGEDFDPDVAALAERPHGFSGTISGAAASTLEGSSHQRVVRGTAPLLKNVRGYLEGPSKPEGIHVDVSPRNLVCMSVFEGEAVVGSCDHALYAIDYRTGERRRTMYNKTNGHEAWVTCVEHLPDGRVLSGGMDSKLCLWGRKSTRCRDLLGHTKSISALNVGADGRFAISASYDETLGVWDLASGSNVSFLSGSHNAPVLGLSWANGMLASGDRNGVCVFWDLAAGGRPVRSLQAHRGHCTVVQAFLGGTESMIAPRDTSSAGAAVFLTGGQDGYVKVWDSRAKGCVATIEAHRTSEGAGAVGNIECSGGRSPGARARGSGGADGSNYIVSAGADKTLCVIDPRGFKRLGTLRHHRDFIYSLQVNGGLCFSGAGDGALMVHDLSCGRPCYALGANRAAVRCVHATDSHLIAAGDDGSVLSFEYGV